MLSRDETGPSPNIIVESYERAYQQLYGREPQVRHIGGPWYYVGGETVHRIMLLSEVKRLREELDQRKPKPSRGVIQRLIAHLRSI